MLDWKIATLTKTEFASADVKSLTFQVSNFPPHLPGQHVTIHLHNSDNPDSQRDYSLANPPEQKNRIELGVQILSDGEVSPVLFNMKPGQTIQIRGPIGGQFIWDITKPEPLILIAGGSGMVPLMSMLRHHIINLEKDKNRQIILIISAKNFTDILYYNELKQMLKKSPNLKIIFTLTKTSPPNWPGYKKRIDQQLLKESLLPLKKHRPLIYLCGSSIFVERLTQLLSQVGFSLSQIKTERFT